MAAGVVSDPRTPSFLLSPEVPGGLGSLADLDASVHPPRVRRLHLVFSGWLGDDLVEVFPCHLVTDRLAAALDSEGLTGLALDDVTVTVDPQFEELFPETAADLPSWRWLRVTGEEGSHDLWLDERARLHVTEHALLTLAPFRLEHCEVREVS